MKTLALHIQWQLLLQQQQQQQQQPSTTLPTLEPLKYTDLQIDHEPLGGGTYGDVYRAVDTRVGGGGGVSGGGVVAPTTRKCNSV